MDLRDTNNGKMPEDRDAKKEEVLETGAGGTWASWKFSDGMLDALKPKLLSLHSSMKEKKWEEAIKKWWDLTVMRPFLQLSYFHKNAFGNEMMSHMEAEEDLSEKSFLDLVQIASGTHSQMFSKITLQMNFMTQWNKPENKATHIYINGMV